MDRLGDRTQDAVTVPRFAGLALLVLTIAIGAYLRFDALGEPCFWLDEILSETFTTEAAAQPWWHWLTGLDYENGPIYYAARLASRVVGSDEAAGRFPFALFGLVTIPLVWFAARSAGDRTAVAPTVCALLLAVSPLNVYYSREARPYALLMFLTAMLVLALLQRASPIIVGAVFLALLYTSATAAPVIAAAFVGVAAAALLTGDRLRSRRDRRLAGIVALAIVLVPLLYRGAPWAVGGNEFPAFDGKFATTVLHAVSVSAFGAGIHGRTALVLLAFTIAGATTMFRRDLRAAVIVVSMTILPAVFAVLPLAITGHFFATRYLAPSLIGFVLLAGTGITATGRGLATTVTRFSFRGGALTASVLPLAIACAIAAQTWSTARREPFQKLDWRAIATALRLHVKPGDVIGPAESYSYLCLRYYLRDLPPDVHFVRLDLIPVAERWARSAPASWLITAGFGTPVSQWMCRYPLLLASPLDGFRLHYVSPSGDFLHTRAGKAEQRAGSAVLGDRGFTLQMTRDDGFALTSGWADAEGSEESSNRWATGRRATLAFPRTGRRDRVIRFRAYPITDKVLPEQTMRISVNGTPAGDLTLAPHWLEYAVTVPAGQWNDGMNEITFEFGRAAAPAVLDPRSGDRRDLAVMFDWIAVDDVGFTSINERRSLPPSVRLATEHFLDARTAWRNTSTRFPSSRLRRDEVTQLLARLGFDPSTAWPQLAHGDVYLDDVVETIAYGSCEDDPAFVRHAFAILLTRAPNDVERESLLRLLGSGASRVEIIGRLAKSDEFRARVLVS
jgi:uncharacterized membrane protein